MCSAQSPVPSDELLLLLLLLLCELLEYPIIDGVDDFPLDIDKRLEEDDSLILLLDDGLDDLLLGDELLLLSTRQQHQP